jgi:hypothetical protein
MSLQRMDMVRGQIVLHARGAGCETSQEVAASHAFAEVVQHYIESLRKRDSALVAELPLDLDDQTTVARLVDLLRELAVHPLDEVARGSSDLAACLDFRDGLRRLVEGLYDYWRGHDRFLVLHSIPGPTGADHRPYRAFNTTVEQLTHLVRGLYRDVRENVTGDHPWVYRQVSAGCNVGLIAVPLETELPSPYGSVLRDIGVIRQLWIDPPLIIDPPMNRRTGRFQPIEENPLEDLSLDPSRFLCYPAQVGPLVIYIYFHQRFMGLGCALANLFELATDEQLGAAPDAIFVYGAPSEAMVRFGDLPTVFYEDEAAGLLAAAVPLEDRFGYFGYLKKMVLTLHNVAAIKRGRMPFHGALSRVLLRGGAAANVLLIGDTATGKSETLEAFRLLGEDRLRELSVIADDMGSLEVASDATVRGYGTEIGAFIRLDDLQQGYAFGQIDRAIIMSPSRTNARVVLPVTSLGEVQRGHSIDFMLYANNYENVDPDHPVVERFENADEALAVFRAGAAMSKGTTTTTGLVHSYFANVFGPPQYRELHEPLAERTFRAAFETGVYVGQMRTRLGIPGWESRGPEEAAAVLLDLIDAQSTSAE